MTAAGQTYQSEPDVLTACRGYYEVGGASVSTAELNTSKLTAWPNSGSGHCVQYIHFPAGKARGTLSACTGSAIYAGTLQLTISRPDGQTLYSGSISLKKSSSEADVTAFDGVNFPEAGWYKLDLSLSSGRFGSMTNWKFYKESSTAAYLATNLSSPSTHLWYSASAGPSGAVCDWLYQEIMIPEGHDLVGTYAMAIGQDRFYMGIQVNEGRRDVIFSVWDNGDTDTDPNLPDYKRSATLDSGEGVTIERFGNEGTGTKAFKKGTYWTPGKFVQFLVNATPIEQTVTNENGVSVQYKSMLITAWYRNEGETEWQYLATHRCAGSTSLFSVQGMYSFLENYISANGQAVRKTYCRNSYAHSTVTRSWYHLNRASFTHTDGGTAAGARTDYGAGAATAYGDCFYMTSGGYGAPVEESLSLTQRTDAQVVADIDLVHLADRVQQAVNASQGIPYSTSIGGWPLVDVSGWRVVDWSDEETAGEGNNGRAAQAMDGNESTYWHSQWYTAQPTFPHSITVEAPETFEIGALELCATRYVYSGTTYNPRSVSIEASDDGETWTRAAESVYLDCVERPRCELPATAKGKFFRLTFDSGYGTYLYLDEIRLYGRPTGTTVDPQENKDGWKHVEDVAELENECTYLLRNAAGMGRLFHNARRSSIYVWLGGVEQLADPSQTLFSADYATAVDSTDAAAAWHLLHVDGQYYLCNAKNRRFASPGRPCTFTTIPTPINITRAQDGFLLAAAGANEYLCAAPHLSFPVMLGSADDSGCVWQILVNPDGTDDVADFLESISRATGITRVDAGVSGEGVVYDLQGRRLRSATGRGVFIMNGKKVVK